MIKEKFIILKDMATTDPIMGGADLLVYGTLTYNNTINVNIPKNNFIDPTAESSAYMNYDKQKSEPSFNGITNGTITISGSFYGEDISNSIKNIDNLGTDKLGSITAGDYDFTISGTNTLVSVTSKDVITISIDTSGEVTVTSKYIYTDTDFSITSGNLYYLKMNISENQDYSLIARLVDSSKTPGAVDRVISNNVTVRPGENTLVFIATSTVSTGRLEFLYDSTNGKHDLDYVISYLSLQPYETTSVYVLNPMRIIRLAVSGHPIYLKDDLLIPSLAIPDYDGEYILQQTGMPVIITGYTFEPRYNDAGKIIDFSITLKEATYGI